MRDTLAYSAIGSAVQKISSKEEEQDMGADIRKQDDFNEAPDCVTVAVGGGGILKRTAKAADVG